MRSLHSFLSISFLRWPLEQNNILSLSWWERRCLGSVSFVFIAFLVSNVPVHKYLNIVDCNAQTLYEKWKRFAYRVWISWFIYNQPNDDMHPKYSVLGSQFQCWPFTYKWSKLLYFFCKLQVRPHSFWSLQYLFFWPIRDIFLPPPLIYRLFQLSTLSLPFLLACSKYTGKIEMYIWNIRPEEIREVCQGSL